MVGVSNRSNGIIKKSSFRNEMKEKVSIMGVRSDRSLKSPVIRLDSAVDCVSDCRPWGHNITKTCLYNFDPLKPHFYIVKLGFTGVYIIFLISAQKQRLWVLVRTDRRGGSNEYLQSMF